MARASREQVQAVVDTSLENGPLIAAIAAAHRIVEDNLEGEGVDPDTLEQVEIFLAAHFVSIRDRYEMSETAGGVQFQFAGKTGMGLDFTPYGQAAKTIDPTGKVAELDKENRRSFQFKVGTGEDHD